jgi:hypothetical protein
MPAFLRTSLPGLGGQSAEQPFENKKSATLPAKASSGFKPSLTQQEVQEERLLRGLGA